MQKKVLVTGGTGYIGSHTLIDLIHHGFEVVSIDNYLNSSPTVLQGVENITGVAVKNYVVDLVDWQALQNVFEAESPIAGIIHFAALKSVGESVAKPLDYFSNNLNGLINILRAAKDFQVPHFIFSSSCSVYGNSKDLPVTEETPFQEAESPYARTKQMGEQIIQDFSKSAQHFNAILLRYFNPAGAHESIIIGESPTYNASNLVPVITEVAIGKREKLTVFGSDYPTRDGSCIRDFIHVMDLANAHTKALEYLMAGKNTLACDIFNVGIGQGVSVLEAIRAFEKVSGQDLNYELGARRPGDVVAIYANLDKASRLLGWQPQRNIEDIMRTAWEWEKFRTLQAQTQ